MSPRFVVVCLMVSLAGLVTLQAALFPVYRAPDESQHVDLVRAVVAEQQYFEPGERHLSQQVQASREQVRDRTPEGPRPLPPGGAPPRGERPTFDELAGDEPSELIQYASNHPPLYYLVLGTGLVAVQTLVPPLADLSHDGVVTLLRLLSAAMIVPLPWLLWRTASQLMSAWAAAAAAAIPLAVPMLAHIGAAVNNDNLLVLLWAAAGPAVVRTARGHGTRRDGLTAGLLVGGALLTKAFALALPATVALAGLLGWRRRRRAGSLTAPLVAVAVAAIVGLWWYARNLAAYGTLQPRNLALPDAEPGFEPDVLWWLPFAVNRVVERFWIEPDTLPDALWWGPWVPAALLVALVVVGVRAHAATRPDLLVLLAPLAAVAGGMLLEGWRLYGDTGAPFGLHGRYLYFAIGGLALPAGAGLARLARGRPALGVAGLVLSAVVLHALAAVAALFTYWAAPAGGLAPRVTALLEWSPLPPLLVLGAGVLSLAAAAVALAAAVTAGVRPTARPGPVRPPAPPERSPEPAGRP